MSLLYHYTNMDSAKKILSSKCLWLQEPVNLNDSTDQSNKFYFDCASSAYTEVVNFGFKITNTLYDREYFISLSQESDLLSQWCRYGSDGRGVCLGFDFSAIESTPKSLEKMRYNTVYRSEVIYISRDELIERLKKLYMENSMHKGLGLETYHKLIFSFQGGRYKHNGFREEKETRLLYYCSENKLDSLRGRYELDISKNLKQVCFGPALSGDLENLKQIICLSGYDELEILKSEIPYKTNF